MKSFCPVVIFLLISWRSLAQSNYSGNVIDAWDKKYLEGVEVSVSGKAKVKTNSRGYFSVSATIGDTLTLNFAGFIQGREILGEDRFFLLELQDKARLLPTFQVKSEPYRFRFKDGKLFLVENEEYTEKKLSSLPGIGAIDRNSPTGGLAIYGPISYFSKRNRELREYEQKLDWLKRRAGYLEIIDSDSIRNNIMSRYGLDRMHWDNTIIRFNQFHQSHEFLDWTKERVLVALNEFFRIENYLVD
jgi:hypothetical protein